MRELFCGASWEESCNSAAASFNEDIGAWDTSGVTTANVLYCSTAPAFNRDIGAWDISGVTTWEHGTTLLPRLGLRPGPRLVRGRRREPGRAFDGTPCASTFCGVSWGGCDIPSNGNVMANGKIRVAVAAWLSDATAAEATYGHISTWETGG